MNLKAKVAALIFLCASTSAFGQSQPKYPISMPSANASNLALYNETPVSEFTGIPQINIPLYTISDGDLSIALGLSYHAAGVQPDIHPGWVGSGWSLQSGGIITRQVNGMPDEYPTDVGGYYDNHSELSPNNWTSTTRLQYTTDGNFDSSPDVFSFSMNGISGQFFLDDQGNWQVKCDQDVKVIFNSATDFTSSFMTTPPPNPYSLNSYFRCFGKFTLIAPDGTTYIFGGNANAIEYSADFFNQNSSNWTATSWNLTQVISADGLHTINFTYERDQYTNVLYWTIFKDISDISTSGQAPCNTIPPVDRTTSLLQGNILSPVYLKSIETSKELIQFSRSTSVELHYPQSRYEQSYQSYSSKMNLTGTEQEIEASILEYPIYHDTTKYKFLPLLRINGLTSYPACLSNLQWKELDNITVTDKANSQIFKKYNFNYTNSAARRLTLLSLEESNPSGAVTDTVPPYRFYYDTSHSLPDYLVEGTDDWGYASGSVSAITADNFANPRPVNPDYVGAGTLKKIIYPTGGYKLFFFEPNNYAAYVSADHSTVIAKGTTLGAGIRIKAIFDYDPFTKSLKSKKYFYVKNFLSPNQLNTASSGIISSLPTFNWICSNHILPTGETLFSNLESRNTLLPMSENSDGSQIGYSEVAEVSDDNSFVVSKFTNFDDGHLDESYLGSLFPEKEVLDNFTSLSLERGKLKYSAVYNSAGKLLKSSTITYAPVHNNRTYVRATDSKRYEVCNYGSVNGGLSGPFVYEGGAYKIYYYSYLPISDVESTSDGATPVVTTTNMYYDNPLNKLLTRKETTRTDGKIVTTLISYPQDYASGTSFIDNMISKNLFAFPIEKVNYLTDPVSGNVNILSGSLTTYNATTPFLKDVDYILETKVPIVLANFKFSNVLKGSLPYNTPKLTFTQDTTYKPRFSYLYNTGYKLSQVNQTNGTSSAVLWGYNNSLPIAQTTNAKITEVYFNGFEEDVTNVSTDCKTGSKSKLLNGGSFALPAMPALSNGQSYLLSYWYKNTGGNWTYSSGLYTTLPAAISGYTLIDEVRICSQNAQMVTASYLTARGQLSSKTDASSRTQYYQYDGLQRLKMVLDDNLNIINNYVYNYAPVQTIPDAFYFNVTKSATFQTTGCSGGRIGTFVTYVVSAGVYASTHSQATADSLAQNDVNSNGQNYANLNGKCMFFNATQTGTFYKSDCTAPQQPSPYVVTIPQGRYSSDVSQADADNQAQAQVTAAGAFVNAEGTCFTPAATISVQNGYTSSAGSPNRTITVTFHNVSTGITYTSATAGEGQSNSFTVPPGTYSIGFGGVGPYNSVQLWYNNNIIDCKGINGTAGNFSNITLANNDSVGIIASTSNCPAISPP